MEKVKVAWIGTGVMGSAMCKHLMDRCDPQKTYVYNRTKEKAKALIDKGAIWCETPGDACRDADFIFTIVGFPSDVEEIYFGERGILNNAKDRAVVIDMTTSKPLLAKRIYNEASDKGIYSLDAPVTGGDIGARKGELVIMVGGDKDIFESAKPYLRSMGSIVEYFGPAGSGQNTKLANQIAIAGNIIGTVESLLYSYVAGLDVGKVIQTISNGSAGSWQLANMGPKMISGNFDPGFYIKHFVKDMGLALDEAKSMGVTLPGLSLANQFYQFAIAQGYENLGTQALYRVLSQMNGEKSK